MLPTVCFGSFHVFCSKQVAPYCGPGEADCVSNQTLKDESCLVPCSGLHADIADDSRIRKSRHRTETLEKNVLEGIAKLTFIPKSDYLQVSSN